MDVHSVCDTIDDKHGSKKRYNNKKRSVILVMYLYTFAAPAAIGVLAGVRDANEIRSSCTITIERKPYDHFFIGLLLVFCCCCCNTFI